MFFSELKHHLHQYTLGSLLKATPLLGGTANSNYLIETSQGKWVFTILEALCRPLAQELVHFLAFLNHHNFPTPVVQLNQKGDLICDFQNKPSLIVSFITGKSPIYPTVKQCYQIGSILGQLHMLTQKYVHPLKNCMDNTWREHAATQLFNHCSLSEKKYIEHTLDLQANLPYKQLPQGIIHFDLFRDNTLFIEDKLEGVIDFYYACHDALIMDLSIAILDWCTDWKHAERNILEDRRKALLAGYEHLRPLTNIEQNSINDMLKISALHFWAARSQHLKKDPREYKQIFLALLNRSSPKE